jgi:DNA-binding CsgD family transcriptional regulator
VALVSDVNGIAANLARALDGHCTLISVTDPAELAGRIFHPDAIVMDFTRLAALYAGDPALHTRISRSSRLLVLATKTDFLVNRDLLGLADAWVLCGFAGCPPLEQMAVALEGHVVLPDWALTRGGADALRADLLGTLSATELTVLHHLGGGIENAAIAAAIGLTEMAVKTAMRGLLTKLHCRNRTEAGLFSHRQSAAIETALAAIRS